MTDNDVFIGKAAGPEYLNHRYANRRGLIAGATGTGKTVSLQILAEGLSNRVVGELVRGIFGTLRRR